MTISGLSLVVLASGSLAACRLCLFYVISFVDSLSSNSWVGSLVLSMLCPLPLQLKGSFYL